MREIRYTCRSRRRSNWAWPCISRTMVNGGSREGVWDTHTHTHTLTHTEASLSTFSRYLRAVYRLEHIPINPEGVSCNSSMGSLYASTAYPSSKLKRVPQGSRHWRHASLWSLRSLCCVLCASLHASLWLALLAGKPAEGFTLGARLCSSVVPTNSLERPSALGPSFRPCQTLVDLLIPHHTPCPWIVTRPSPTPPPPAPDPWIASEP
jgi:hypothetical protein